jgi:hypothetical protein
MFEVDLYGLSYLTSPKNLIDLLNSFLVVGIFWNTFNLIFVSMAIFYLIRFNRIPKSDFKFIIQKMVSLIGNNDQILLAKMNLKGALLVSSQPILNPVIQFQLQDEDVSLDLQGVAETIEQVKNHYKVTIQFINMDIETKIKLTNYFSSNLIPQLFLNDFKHSTQKTLKLVLPIPEIPQQVQKEITESEKPPTNLLPHSTISF